MKKIVSLALFVALAAPVATQALSCVDPASMAEQYVTSSDYVIFTGTAGETKEHIKRGADPDGLDPNFQFNESLVGQYVEVTELHKGQVSGNLWVYHQKNSTWSYMCSSGPAEAGTSTLYIVTPPSGLFDLPQVVNSYPVDSQLAQDLLTRLAETDDNGPAYANFTTSETWRSELPRQLREMIYHIRIKLAEWRWWRVNAE